MNYRHQSLATAVIAACVLAGAAGAQTGSLPTGGGTSGGGVSAQPIAVLPYFYDSISGTVAKIGASDILIQTGSDPSQTVDVLVTSNTRYVREDNVDVDQLAMGDHLSVNGLPKEITAKSMQAGDNVFIPTPLPLKTGSQSGSPVGGPLPPIPAPTYVSANAYATGIVSSVDVASRIVILTLSDNSPLPIDVPADVKAHRTRTIDLSGVKVGDSIFVSGSVPWPQPEAGGTGTSSGIGTTGKGTVTGTPISTTPSQGTILSPPLFPTGPFTANYVRVGDIGPVYYGGPLVEGAVSSGGVSPAVPASGVDSGSGTAGGGLSPVSNTTSGAAALARGNLTGSGHVSVADATLALDMAVGLAQPTASQLAAGDLFNEGRITLRDATVILRAAVFGLTL